MIVRMPVSVVDAVTVVVLMLTCTSVAMLVRMNCAHAQRDDRARVSGCDHAQRSGCGRVSGCVPQGGRDYGSGCVHDYVRGYHRAQRSGRDHVSGRDRARQNEHGHASDYALQGDHGHAYDCGHALQDGGDRDCVSGCGRGTEQLAPNSTVGSVPVYSPSAARMNFSAEATPMSYIHYSKHEAFTNIIQKDVGYHVRVVHFKRCCSNRQRFLHSSKKKQGFGKTVVCLYTRQLCARIRI